MTATLAAVCKCCGGKADPEAPWNPPQNAHAKWTLCEGCEFDPTNRFSTCKHRGTRPAGYWANRT